MSLLEDTRKLIDMYKLGEVKKILNIIDEELMKIPNTRTFRQRGIISVNYEKKFGLKKFLEQVLEINPNDPEILSRLALIFELNGNIENASNFADKSLKIDSDNKTALQVKGIIAFNNSGNAPSGVLNELTFWPKRVISINPSEIHFLVSSTILSMDLLRSRPLVKGTIQKVQNLSQPRIIEIQAFIPSFLDGYRSS